MKYSRESSRWIAGEPEIHEQGAQAGVERGIEMAGGGVARGRTEPGGERQLWPALGDHALGGHEQALGTLGSAGTGDGGGEAQRLRLILELGQPTVERRRVLLTAHRAQRAGLAGDRGTVVRVDGERLVVGRQGVLHPAHVDEHAGGEDVRQRARSPSSAAEL